MSACQAPGCTREAAFASMPENERRPDVAEILTCARHLGTLGISYASGIEEPKHWIVYSVAPVEIPANAPGTPPVGDRLGPLRRWRGLTWIGWLNYLALRWFLVRLHYGVEQDNTISRYYFRFTPTWRW
jgi:hypothetical protein